MAHCLALLPPELADLAVVVAGWPDLPPAVRAGILAMVEAVAGGDIR